MKQPKAYLKGILKIEPLNRLAEKDDIVSWINLTSTVFYARVLEIKSDQEVWFKNNYPTNNSQYCHTFSELVNLIPIRLYLIDSFNKDIGTVSKNIEESFLKNETLKDDVVWYELKKNLPRKHRGNLICI